MATAESSASGTVDPGVPSLDGLGDPVVAISADGTLLYANTVASEVLDWDPADLIGTSVLDLIHPADLIPGGGGAPDRRDQAVRRPDHDPGADRARHVGVPRDPRRPGPVVRWRRRGPDPGRRPRRDAPAPPRLRPGRYGRAAGRDGEHARDGRARRRDRRDPLDQRRGHAPARLRPRTHPWPVDPRLPAPGGPRARARRRSLGAASWLGHPRRPLAGRRLQRARRGDHLRVHGQQPARRPRRPQLRDQCPDRHGPDRRTQPGELPRRARQPHRPAQP